MVGREVSKVKGKKTENKQLIRSGWMSKGKEGGRKKKKTDGHADSATEL